MLFPVLFTFVGLLAVQCRDISKSFETIPAITGSLVNLGKMDISFHFNSKDPAFKTSDQTPPQQSFFSSKSEPIFAEPCPCTSLKEIKENFGNRPSDILSKILMSNDLFSFNKEQKTSTLCCGSHEHAQEDIVTFEFGPQDGISSNSFASPANLPFIFENILSKRPPISPIPPPPKAVEIFFLPQKKRDSTLFMPKKNSFPNKDIQIVGDKELKNDFKSLKFRPSLPLNFQSSVKKDLTAQEKGDIKVITDKKDMDITSTTNPNAL